MVLPPMPPNPRQNCEPSCERSVTISSAAPIKIKRERESE